MFRVHQFNKVEMFVFTTPDDAWAEHDRMVALEEDLLTQLGLPYRVVNVAAGDLGAPAAKKIDIEAWFPAQERYREVTSCSNTTDFQARRLGIRFRGESGLETPHTLNGTVVTDRALLAILENFQGEVPDVLLPYGAPERVTAEAGLRRRRGCARRAPPARLPGRAPEPRASAATTTAPPSAASTKKWLPVATMM